MLDPQLKSLDLSAVKKGEEVIDENGGGPGVCLRKSVKESLENRLSR